MNNIDDLYIAEQGRKLSQFIAEQIDRGIREALGADTASLIENQAARIAELEADRDLMQQQADECIVASGSCGLSSADLPDYITGLKAERADRDRLASIVERARNGHRDGGSATIWSLREQRDNCLVRIAELEAAATADALEAALDAADSANAAYDAAKGANK